MANITRFNPFSELARFDSIPDTNDFFNGFGLRSLMRDVEREPRVKMDVSENDGNYTVKAEIPGVNKNDIHISVDGNLVSISAEVKKEKEEKSGESVISRERYYGKVSRSFSLANEVDAEKVQANYADGVLEIKMPIKSGANRKQITVS